MRRLALALALLGLLGTACGGGGGGVDPLTLPVDAPGPWRAGYRTWEITYLPPAQERDRFIDVHVWYPTDEELDPARAPVYEGHPARLRDREALRDAVPARGTVDGGFPVIAFSHGHRGVAEGSHRLARWFASHGWLFLSVGHVGNRFIDGPSGDVTPVTHWHERPLDISEALNALTLLPVTDPLHGLARTERVVVTGHSRGSYTPWALVGAAFDVDHVQAQCDADAYPEPCTDAQVARFSEGFRDPRVVGGIPTAGGGHRELFDGVDGQEAIEAPILMLSADADGTSQDDLFADIGGRVDVTWVELAEGCHEVFNLGCGGAQDELGFPPFATYALAFARARVLGDTDPTVLGILDGSVSVSERATYMR